MADEQTTPVDETPIDTAETGTPAAEDQANAGDTGESAAAEPVVATEPEVDQTRATNATLLIEVATGTYPVTLGQIFAKYKASFPAEPLLHDLQTLGYAEVKSSTAPTGDVVTEGKPELKDGVWYRTWTARDFDADEIATQLENAKSSAQAAINAARINDFSNGPAFTDSNGNTFHVQVRDRDRVNLFYLNTVAQQRIAANDSTTETFRGLENISYELSPADLKAMTEQGLVAYKTILAKSWTVGDQVTAATTVADIPTIPASFLVDAPAT